MRPAENIEKQIKKLRYDTDAEAHKKIFDNVMQAVDKREMQKSGTTSPDVRRIIMKNPITKIAAAAAIIIAVLIGMYFFPGGGGSTAYARVANQLRVARTLTYRVTTYSNIEMEMAFKEPRYMRITMPGGYVTVADWTQGKALINALFPC